MRKILTLFILTLSISCDRTEFTEYPAERFMVKNQQSSLINTFISKIEGENISDDNLKLLREMYQLRYIEKGSDSLYFMISRKGHFLSSGLECFGGTVDVRNSDTTFHIRFVINATREYGQDSVKAAFRKMLNNR